MEGPTPDEIRDIPDGIHELPLRLWAIEFRHGLVAGLSAQSPLREAIRLPRFPPNRGHQLPTRQPQGHRITFRSRALAGLRLRSAQ